LSVTLGSSDQLSFALGSGLIRSMHCLSPGQNLLYGHERSTPTFVIGQVERCLGSRTTCSGLVLAIPL
jgi:hypothetical protein